MRPFFVRGRFVSCSALECAIAREVLSLVTSPHFSRFHGNRVLEHRLVLLRRCPRCLLLPVLLCVHKRKAFGVVRGVLRLPVRVPRPNHRAEAPPASAHHVSDQRRRRVRQLARHLLLPLSCERADSPRGSDPDDGANADDDGRDPDGGLRQRLASAPSVNFTVRSRLRGTACRRQPRGQKACGRSSPLVRCPRAIAA